MSKYRFDISQAGYDTIKIEADDGFVFDTWKDLTAPSCLTVPDGSFSIEADKTLFKSSTILNFTFIGKPFDAAVGDTGEAVIELFEPGCTNYGWRWKLISK